VNRYSKDLVSKIRKLRSDGKTYSEINKTLHTKLAKSSLHWICKDTLLPLSYINRISRLNVENLGKARATSLAVRQAKKEEFEEKIYQINLPIANKINNKNTAKIALAMLCLGEASKSGGKSSFCLGNSDHRIITLFLRFLKICFEDFDSKKIRCTVQCRADQDTSELERYWQEASKIPFDQFYKTRIDPRTIGKPTLKKGYRGVLKVDYLNTKTQLELESLAQLVYNRVSKGP